MGADSDDSRSRRIAFSRERKRAREPIDPAQFARASGLFVTGTDTEVGKTVIAGAIARILHDRGLRVGVSKPVASGCRRRQGVGLVSQDAEFLAWAADSPFDLATISPARYAEPLAPYVAANRSGTPLDVPAIAAAYNRIAADSDFVVVEGIGGLMVPLTRRLVVLDLAAAMGLPLLVVARPVLGTLNHTVLTVEAARSRGLRVAAVAISRYNPDTPDLAESTNPQVLAELTGLPVVCVPDDDQTRTEPPPAIGEAVLFACRQIPLETNRR